MTVTTNGTMSAASLGHVSVGQNQNLLKHNLDCSSNSSSDNVPGLDDLPPFGQYYYNATENKDDITEEISGVIAAAEQQQEQQQQYHLIDNDLPRSPIFDSPLTPQGLMDDEVVVLPSTIITATTTTTNNNNNTDLNKVEQQQQHVNKGKKHRRQPSMRNLSAELLLHDDEDYDDANHSHVCDDNVEDLARNDICISKQDQQHRHVHKKHRRQPSMRNLVPLLHLDDVEDNVVFEDRDDDDDEEEEYAATNDINAVNKVHHRKKHRRLPSMRNLSFLNDELMEVVVFEDNDAGDDDRDASGVGVAVSHDDFVMNMAASSNDGNETDGNVMKKKQKTIPNFITWERQDLSFLLTPNTSMNSSLQGQPSMVLSPACSSSVDDDGNCFEDRLLSLSRSTSESSVATTATNMATIAPRPPVAATSPWEKASTTMSTININNNGPSNKSSSSGLVHWIVGLVHGDRQETPPATDDNGNNNAMFYLSRLETIGRSSSTYTTLYLRGPEMIQQVQSLDESSSSHGRRRRRSRHDKKFLIYLPGSTCFVLKDAAQAVRAIEAEMAAAAEAERQCRRQEAPTSNDLDGTGGNHGGFRSRRSHFWQLLKKLGCPLLGESKNSAKSDAGTPTRHRPTRRQRTWSSSAAQAEVAKGDSDCLH
jgi:hypothetical protein